MTAAGLTAGAFVADSAATLVGHAGHHTAGWTLTGLSAVLMFSGIYVAYRALRRLDAAVDQFREATEQLASGEWQAPLPDVASAELAPLRAVLERLRVDLKQSVASRNWLDTVLDSMNDAVLLTSPEGKVRRANIAAQKLLGYSEDELLERPFDFLIAAPDREAFVLDQAAQDTRELVIAAKSGQTIPVLMTGSTITAVDPQFQGLIFVMRNITERKRAERRIRYLARFDALTKIPNRMQFQHSLQQAIARARRSGTTVAMLYIDLDRFKEVNDTFGHAAGDRTLEILTERLSRSVPKDATTGRLAGDEFAVFVENLPAGADARARVTNLARTLLAELARPFHLETNELVVTASTGIALSPDDADNVIDLIRNADAAMYHAKQNGGNTYALYAPEMNAAAVERLMLKSKLRRALERNEFVMQYQPKIDLKDGRIVGAEALIRWRLPGHGDISPSQFIPLAEESNLILDIGQWVLRRVCEDYRGWLGSVVMPGRVSINLSLKQLRQAEFVTRFKSIFAETGVPPEAMELEITETTLMSDARRMMRLLDELYAMGLHLSIDDFGTGYSSLSALQQYPIGTLKIDQSFVRHSATSRGDATLVRTIIEMGRSMGLKVVAEGVETVQQFEFLRNHGCDYAQGRLFGDAVNADEFLKLLDEQARGELRHERLFVA